ncbi:MAG: histidine--tRNA ligase [Desulfobulbaceae bacterium]|nr:histidine--tRNA ligase [Desulfobulbaceae bacterium]HIJ89557.1 histidine--tRNA ligase [Deltaproteobacteria bacterium]
MTIQALKGFKDILPDEVRAWQHIEATAREIFHRFGFTEIRVPILEKTELFARSIGEATDIVEKEMYSFADRNGDSITMRPEGTASVLRAFIEHGLQAKLPVQRLYTIGPMFRHERPQKGRLRQFHQMSVEVLGLDHPRLDAELIAMGWLILDELGLSVSLQINSLGCPACRPAYKEALVNFLAARKELICEDCQRRSLTNPLRVLDCKSSHCQEQYVAAPSILDHLCPGCSEHFRQTKESLDLLAIPYAVNPFMVRGLDYYTRTTFELVTDALGAQSAVGAGGRYDGLVEKLGGAKNMPGIGFAMGMERLALLMTQQNEGGCPDSASDLFVAALGEEAAVAVFPLVHFLRRKGLRVAMDLEGKSLKSQMKQADRAKARYALILGEEELARGEAVLRDMTSKEQQAVPLAGAPEGLCAMLVEAIAPKGK